MLSLGQSWSIAVEFQFYFLSPLLVLSLLHGESFFNKRGFLLADVPAPFRFMRERARGHAVLMYFVVFSTASRAVVLLTAAQGNGWYAFFDTLHMYTPVWTRMGPYLLGMGSAYHYLCIWHCKRPAWLQRDDRRAKLVRWSTHTSLALLWLVIATFGIGGGDGIGFRLSWLPAYPPPLDLPTVTMGQPGPVLQIAFAIFGRILFSTSVCYFILMTLVGRARYLNALLSMRLLVPIARLSYGAYLLQFIGTHWGAQLINLASTYNVGGVHPIETGELSVSASLGLFMVYQWIALPITFGLALLVHLFVEKPIMLLRS